ncbi:hypothetical protein BD324DRAFT_627315 [Kockovaella imperatae]|uniref:Uncharacterized protein n=1 Tax=Kockovaella imperatae TaxID=4999 RepID=A0A1Y1UFK5_9TREE|nr:hypothetical protein BD324DRAFT_627315 [Kockovaella imperatae]ORX36823.1 hypothetical protein BD324DRAFT_627315 [Kockovaella imperatae]
MSIDLDGPSNRAGPSRIPPDYPLTHVHSVSDASQLLPSSVGAYALGAGAIGFIIGAKRGGARARLRFLAENAHRPPKTKEGWYWYLRARNYIMIKNGVLTGVRYGSAFSIATGCYALLDESIGWYRENRLGDVVPRAIPEEEMRRFTWRRGEVRLYDGAIAGGLLSASISLLWRLPRTLFFRAFVLAIGLGSLESGLQMVRDKLEVGAQDQVRAVRAEVARKEKEEEDALTDKQRQRLKYLREGGDFSASDRRRIIDAMNEETRLAKIAQDTSESQKNEGQERQHPTGGDGSWWSWRG